MINSPVSSSLDEISVTSTAFSNQTEPSGYYTTPSTSGTIFQTIPGAACVPENTLQQTAHVIEIIDGDTVEIELDGKNYTVRYIGIDTPERGMPGYDEATAYNRSLVEGRDVLLVMDESDVDDFGRLLRYVFVDQLFVNYELVKAGFAQAGYWPPDTSCSQSFAAVEKKVDLSNNDVIEVDSSSSNETAACPQGCTTPPQGCLIKGNINTEGVKIYHIPGGEYYEKTVISPEFGERWFCTDAEAQANGWRQSMK